MLLSIALALFALLPLSRCRESCLADLRLSVPEASVIDRFNSMHEQSQDVDQECLKLMIERGYYDAAQHVMESKQIQV